MDYKKQFDYYLKESEKEIVNAVKFILKFTKPLKNTRYLKIVKSIIEGTNLSDRQKKVLINFIIDNN